MPAAVDCPNCGAEKAYPQGGTRKEGVPMVCVNCEHVFVLPDQGVERCNPERWVAPKLTSVKLR